MLSDLSIVVGPAAGIATVLREARSTQAIKLSAIKVQCFVNAMTASHRVIAFRGEDFAL